MHEKKSNSDMGNVIGIIGIILTIVLSFLIFSLQKKDREPIFFVEENPKVIINKNNITDFPLIIKAADGKVINDNLNMTNIGFGNKGKESIRRENILKDIIFKINSDVEIIDFRIIRESRDIVNSSIVKLLTEENAYKLDFDILDYKDGVEIQIIYIGNPELEITVDGVIEGLRGKIEKKFVKRYTVVGMTIANFDEKEVDNILLFE